MTQHPAPKRVLLIGGGMGGLIREMLKHPVDELHYIELDPVLLMEDILSREQRQRKNMI